MRQSRARRAHRLGIATASLALVVGGLVAAPGAVADDAADSAHPEKIWSGLAEDFAAAPSDTQEFWVKLSARADNSAERHMSDWAARGTAVAASLRANAETSQAPVRAILDAAGATYQSFWMVNVVYVEAGNRDLALALSAVPGVDGIFNGLTIEQDEPIPGTPEPKVGAVEWGIADVNADDVWDDYGVTGEGIVVANIDTGVSYTHSALVNQYRGNLGGGNFDHNYNWYDPIGATQVPTDGDIHGTHTMGTIVGGDGGANQIGVAPGAKWIASNALMRSIPDFLKAMQWMLEPRDLAGNNPDASKRPNVISNSWGVAGVPTDPFGDEVQQAWIDSGIFGTWSNRNLGPGCNSTGSPGGRVLSYSNGAYDINHAIASFSSRGPGQDGMIKPNISGPGVNVRSSVPNGSYQSLSGTSMSTPHLAGAVALLWSAAPALIGDIEGTRAILNESAVDTPDLTCGGTAENNNVFGEGRLDVLAAMELAPIGDTGKVGGEVTEADSGDAISGALVSFHADDFHRDTTTGADGSYVSTLPVGTYEMTVKKFGYVTFEDTIEVEDDVTLTVDVELDVAPVHSLKGKVRGKGSKAGVPGVEITLEGTELTAKTNAKGIFKIKAVPEGSYEVTAVGAACYKPQTKELFVDGARSDGSTGHVTAEKVKFNLKSVKDGAGYTCVVEKPNYRTGSTVLDLKGDEKTTVVDLPFSFPYYGKTYDEIQVSTNGHVRVVQMKKAAPENTELPDPEVPNGVIAAFWDDMIVKSGQTEVRTSGNASRFTIEYSDLRFYGVSGAVDVSLTLFSNGEIAIAYDNLKGALEKGESATVGIENHNGKNGFQFIFESPTLSDNTAVRFLPPAA